MKPGDLYLGVVDFFAIVLPGAIAVAYLDHVGGRGYAEKMLPTESFSGFGGWVLFALAAYAVGHLVFLFASFLDNTYDFFRRRVWPDVPGNAYSRAKALRDAALGTTDARFPMNTFAWAKAVLQLRAQRAAVDVARLEADQKFFRSLCLVLGLVGVHSLFRERILVGGVLVIAGIFAYARYVERRYKSTQWAYYYVIAASTGTSDSEAARGESSSSRGAESA